MVFTIVVMNNDEEFLKFLDPELCTLEETIEYGGLRTLQFSYTFQDFIEDKELFRIGNKIWVQGDSNLQDCLYVINTEVTQDIYQENTFTLELEEVLVELNYAPLFSQTELTNTTFHTITSNGNQEVIVDWNSLNYWFGPYFNIGVVQKCISEYASRISVTGTINRMTLLRNIEEETGNVFVTRYEKDLLNNTIHRYLDFLNPINCNKDWTLNLEYDFEPESTTTIYDAQDNETTEDKEWEVLRYYNTAFDEESIDETTNTDDEDDYDVEVEEPYDTESNELYDYEKEPDYTPIQNIDPSVCTLRITDGENLLNTDGEVFQDNGDTALSWECSDVGLDDTDYPKYLITLQKEGDILGLTVNTKSFVVVGIGNDPIKYVQEIKGLDYGDYMEIAQDNERSMTAIPDDCYFEIYNTRTSKTLFQTKLNTEIGHVHEEILDFGFNLENIEYNVDETNTYTAVSPIIQPNNENSTGKTLSRTDIDTIINRWEELSITKGDIIPMIVEKVNVTSTGTWQDAAATLGNYDATNPYQSTSRTNWWARPLKPNDNTDSTDSKTYEFYRATAYWKAPYTKNYGELHISTEKAQNIEYTCIHNRKDTRDERNGIQSPKIGNTETSDEDMYAIYNQVCQYLKEHETPEIEVNLDVANLIGHEYNNYDLHDKIYVKLANTRELITARITKTTKEAHDIAKNTVEITNYQNINTVKTLTHATYIDASNSQFDYPNSKTLTARLINYEPDENTDTYLANKLITFTLYKIENGSSTLTSTNYTKLTDAYGYCSINMKYDPGDYEIKISFMGDEEYEESSLTITVNVGGTKEVPTTNNTTNTTTKSKTTNKTSTKTKTVKIYWTKCGLGPENKKKIRTKIVSVSKPSSADANKYSYRLYKTVFKNYCPNCKRWGTLRFDGGKKNKCITSVGAHGRGYKVGVPEHEITCIHCDSDYCGVTGLEKSYGHISRLKTVESPVKSSEKEFKKLVKGKLLYGTKEVKVKTKKVENNKDRKIRASGISDTVKKQALAIVKNKTGYKAARAIVTWVDKNIKYEYYPNFVRSPQTCLSKGTANCCDGTRLIFQLLDAAGLCEYYQLWYIHVDGHVYGQVVTKSTGKKRYVDSASDSYGAWGYVCRNYRGRSILQRTRYPKKPFQN